MSTRDLAKRVLIQGGILAVVLAAVAGTLGWFAIGERGLWSALAGVALASIFMLLTAASFWAGERLRRKTGSITAFFGIVMGTWLVKLIGAILALALMTGQPWIDAPIFVWSMIAGVLGSLGVEVVAFVGLLKTDKVDQY